MPNQTAKRGGRQDRKQARHRAREQGQEARRARRARQRAQRAAGGHSATNKEVATLPPSEPNYGPDDR